MTQIYIKQNIHKHRTQNFRRISPLGITPVEKAHKARTRWKLLQNLNPRKAAGPDDIPCHLPKLLAPALTLLFTKSVCSGEVQALGNMPTTSVCGKLLEHIVRAAMTMHFNRNNILVDSHHGFHKRRSCET